MDRVSLKPASKTKIKKEAEILMRRARRAMRADWEFKRFLEYIEKHQSVIIAIGRDLLIDDDLL